MNPDLDYWAQVAVAALLSLGSLIAATLLLRRFFPHAKKFVLLDAMAVAAAVSSCLMTGIAVWIAGAAWEPEFRIGATIVLAPMGFYGMALIAQRVPILPWVALLISATLAASAYHGMFDRMATAGELRTVADESNVSALARAEERYQRAVEAEEQRSMLVNDARQALQAAEESKRVAERAFAAVGGERPAEQVLTEMSVRVSLLRDQLAEARAQFKCETAGPIGCRGMDGIEVAAVGDGPNARALDAQIERLESQIAVEEAELYRFRADTGSVREARQKRVEDAATLVASRDALLKRTLEEHASAVALVAEIDAEIARLSRPTTVQSQERQINALLAVTTLDEDSFILGASWLLALFFDVLSFQFLRHSRPPAQPWSGLKTWLSHPFRWIWHGGTRAEIHSARAAFDAQNSRYEADQNERSRVKGERSKPKPQRSKKKRGSVIRKSLQGLTTKIAAALKMAPTPESSGKNPHAQALGRKSAEVRRMNKRQRRETVEAARAV